MREVLATAEAAGISAPNLNDEAIETIVGDALANYGPQASSPSAFRPSMLVDLEAGRPIEVEAIVGGIVQTARSKGVATPQYAKQCRQA
jgi:2-dehydropantoate 2-reductase